MDTSRAFEVRPATNGGFIVRDANNPMQPGAYRDDIAAFSNATHLIAWLAKEHGVPFGGFDVPAEHVESMKAAIAGEWHPGVLDFGIFAEGGMVSSERLPLVGERAGETVFPPGWIAWSGGKCPVDKKTIVDVKFRNGTERSGHYAKAWSWEHRSLTEGGDIVAYRLV